MAKAEFTTNPHNVCHKCAPSADLPHTSEHVNADAQSHITPLEEAIDEERARQFINKSVRRLEYEEIRRLMHSSMGYDK